MSPIMLSLRPFRASIPPSFPATSSRLSSASRSICTAPIAGPSRVYAPLSPSSLFPLRPNAAYLPSSSRVVAHRPDHWTCSFHSSPTSLRTHLPPQASHRSLHISAPLHRAPPVAPAHIGPNGIPVSTATAGQATHTPHNGATSHGHGHGHGSGSGSGNGHGQGGQKKKSGHMVWYREIVPGEYSKGHWGRLE